MSKVAVVTDSCASIPARMIEKLNIEWVPYYIHRGKEVLRDLVSVQRDEFYQWLPTALELPKTASPGPGDYVAKYQQLAEKGIQEIISIHMTSKGSGAYQAAMAAKNLLAKKLPQLKIEIVDTLNVSLCQGWMAIEAARDALAGLSLEAITRRVQAMIPRSQMLQTADTLKYLYMGGRIGRAKHLVGSLLNIMPLISMNDGVIVALGQARTRKRIYQMMADKIEAAVDTTGAVKIAYVHAAASDEAEKLKILVERRVNCVESFIAELSPALGVHSGPGTVGLCYYHPVTAPEKP